MPGLEKQFANLTEALIRSERMSHASVVVTCAAVLDYDLERSIKWKMRPLNKAMTGRLFGMYAPLSSFAAKIDMAYALDITTMEVHKELHKIRKIRNAFSHSKALLSLDKPPLCPLFDALKRPPGATGTYNQVFIACMVALDDFLEAFLARMGETEDLRIFEKRSPR